MITNQARVSFISIPRIILLCAIVVALFGIQSTGIAQSDVASIDKPSAKQTDSESFAGAFFVARVTNPDGTKKVDFVGTMLLWMLLSLSVLSLGLIGAMATTNQRKAYVPGGVIREVKTLLSVGKLREALDLTNADESFFSKSIHAALHEISQGSGPVIRALEQTSDELTTIRLRRVEYLNILAQVSPMIGLFGTVWGMIQAFRSIVLAGGNADPVLLAGGIGTALTTTFWGLFIAIPALAAYAILRNRIDEFTTDAVRQAEEIVFAIRLKDRSSAREKSMTPAATS